MAIETYLGEEITKRKTKCRLCSQDLFKGEKRVAVEYDPYTYTTSKHKFMNYYHPKCWSEKNTVKKRNNSKKKDHAIYIVIIMSVILFLISKIFFFVTLFIFLAIGIAYVLHKTS